jgi:cysteine desulfurase
MARAFQLAIDERQARIKHVQPLRDRLIEKVLQEIPDARLSGHPTSRLPNHASFVFKSVDGNALLSILDIQGFACSSGSACKTGDPEPSDVLLSIGVDREWALGSLRVTLGTGTTASQVEEFTQFLPEAVKRARALS